ncbi:hypothetical protein [Frigidibacter oleivorans]|uniref:hypothetical protein n=1 Tax=Frigidibacter oleivorans TaxID=2487129 RepID=UPI000F8C8D35|nr:hypothetical protein [Frigidibacter oleivorans]
MTEDPRQVVEEELARGLPSRDHLPEHLRPVLERHCANLVGLAAALQAAGNDRDTVREVVGKLVRTYEADLIAALETR